jgi:hypothetical protein
MRFAVESWAPEYGSAMGSEEQLAASDARIDVDVEVPAHEWAPRSPAPGTTPASCVVFTDGVRRVDAQVWVEGADGSSRPGICASYAAGAVRCNGRAEVVAAEIRRGLFTAAPGAEAIATRHGEFLVRAVGGDAPDELSLCLQQRMGELEVEVAALACESELVCVDGPLRAGGHRPGTVGYVKTHHVRYLPPAQDAVVARLEAGQRTPIFLASARMWTRYLWYLRLPGAAGDSAGGHPWSGVVRCETSADADPAEAVALADRIALTLPRFASQAHKDARAPQNLYPIAGLERVLRHRLGDATLLYRALRAAAAATRSHDAPIAMAE